MGPFRMTEHSERGQKGRVLDDDVDESERSTPVVVEESCDQ